ncbi:MAG TPA: hypothetical protein VJN32_04470 [Dehalococcoidia bacterium]|nr:hypothetical protein [Dehalococcoidia bacterium]
MPTLNGACPGCGQTLTLEVTVRTAPRGFTSGSKQVQLVGDREPGQGTATPSAVNSGERPTCPTCGLDCKLVEAVAKKGENKGRRFRGWKCVNSECDQNDKFAEFHWLTEAAAA